MQFDLNMCKVTFISSPSCFH